MGSVEGDLSAGSIPDVFVPASSLMFQDVSRIYPLIGSFDLGEAVDFSSREYMARLSDEKQALRDLNQMLRDITSDGFLSEYEVTTLQHWVEMPIWYLKTSCFALVN